METLKFTKEDILKTYSITSNKLLSEMNSQGYWEGELSSSPLSTAVASFALSCIDIEKYSSQINHGLTWLASNINEDGGWGDSPKCKTNLSTTLLCWSAFSLADKMPQVDYQKTIEKTEAWLKNRVGSLNPEDISAAVLAYYGDDKTFSAPILLFCALAGRLGPETTRWKYVPQLPMELAAFPHQLFKWMRLPVVSYAIPALIAIGLARHKHSPARCPLARNFRNLVTKHILKVLRDIQPVNGGFLEATPLTGFVLMSLASSGYCNLEVIRDGATFLINSQREDGSWPIDTNLATWVTTLAVNSFSHDDENGDLLTSDQREVIREWLLNQQHKVEHPFTHATPGGWAWIDLPGGVPDADDTAGAILALKNIGPVNDETKKAASGGINWLLDLQNSDGGIPTFCKGWGKLPFDKSCPDISAHALRAFAAWRDLMDADLQKRIDKALPNGMKYLSKSQRKDGSWLPLWFGNQFVEHQENPTYGTAQVVMALRHKKLNQLPGVDSLLKKGVNWLISAQNKDGGWGSTFDAPSTLEETALACNAISGNCDKKYIFYGTEWLVKHIKNDSCFEASPIGLYFASLWYYEKLYPVVFTLSVLNKILKDY